MPWLAATLKDQDIPDFEAENVTHVDIRNIEISEGKTSPPDFLTESELISLVGKIAVCIDNADGKKWHWNRRKYISSHKQHL